MLVMQLGPGDTVPVPIPGLGVRTEGNPAPSLWQSVFHRWWGGIAHKQFASLGVWRLQLALAEEADALLGPVGFLCCASSAERLPSPAPRGKRDGDKAVSWTGL